MMRQLLYSELIKFKFELLSLIQWLKTINLFSINIQTYLSINLLVFIGIGINIFVLSTLPEIVYTQEIYDIIYYVGTVIYVLFVAFTNYAYWVESILTFLTEKLFLSPTILYYGALMYQIYSIHVFCVQCCCFL